MDTISHISNSNFLLHYQGSGTGVWPSTYSCLVRSSFAFVFCGYGSVVFFSFHCLCSPYLHINLLDSKIWLLSRATNPWSRLHTVSTITVLMQLMSNPQNHDRFNDDDCDGSFNYASLSFLACFPCFHCFLPSFHRGSRGLLFGVSLSLMVFT